MKTAAILAAVAAIAAGATLGGRGAEAQEPVVDAVAHGKIAKQLLKERDTSRATIGKLRRALRKERRFTSLVRHPSPENNRALARLLFPEGFWALDKIANGESSWHETVWNGGGTDPRGPGPTAQSCGGGGIAYGIGQACPRSKMADWAGTEGIYRINSLQIHWMVSYATGRYGSLAAAGNYWNASRSW